MKLVVGLGNPGEKYKQTRHNIGFFVIDRLSERWGIPVQKKKWQALVGEGHRSGEKVVLMKPETYMNRSGAAVRPALDFYRMGVEDVVVIYDDLDLPVGQLRLRTKGSSGGHNGVKSVIDHLGTEQFKRIRIGIGRVDSPQSVTEYVLSPFSTHEKEAVAKAVDAAAGAVDSWLEDDFLIAMNRYNKK